jgi:hypothetical protein
MYYYYIVKVRKKNEDTLLYRSAPTTKKDALELVEIFLDDYPNCELIIKIETIARNKPLWWLN